MAPLPKRRISRARAGKRQQHIKMSMKSLVICSNCGAKKLQHQICPECKTYASTDSKTKKK
jgi:large subunit ribosomal protein L32